MTPSLDPDLNDAATQLESVARERIDALAAVDGALVAPEDLDARCRALITRIHAGDQAAASAALAIVSPGAEPPAPWWGTALGIAIALSDETANIPVRRAALVLGVKHPRVVQLAEAGLIERHPDGGITAASLRARRYGSPEGNRNE